MNTDSLIALSRSGSLFCAVSPTSMRKINVLRRLLCVDTPNTTAPVDISDAGIVRCSNEDALFAALYRYILGGMVHHTRFAEAEGGGCSGVTFHTADDKYMPEPVSCSPERSARVQPSRYGDYVARAERPVPAPVFGTSTFRVATGGCLKSLAVVAVPLCAAAPHRCSIQILTLPASDPEAIQCMAEHSPQRYSTTTPVRQAPPGADSSGCGSPTQAIAEHLRESQHFTPNCCFGIYCPDFPEEIRFNRSLADRAPFTTGRWLGLYWIAGASIPQLALVGGISRDGVPRALHVRGNIVLKENDVLSIETTTPPGDRSGDGGGDGGQQQQQHGEAIFFINGTEVQRVDMGAFFPTFAYFEQCRFGVQLSTGSAVAILSGDLAE